MKETILRLTGETPIKIQSMIHYPTEVSAFGICKDDPLKVVDLLIPKQVCSMGFTRMDEEDLADETVRLAKEGFPPLYTNRIWIHTHPGGGIPTPSHQDWKCFESLMENGWAVMLIFSKDNHYCRLGFKSTEYRVLSSEKDRLTSELGTQNSELKVVELPVYMDLSYYGHPKTKETIQKKVTEEKKTWTVPKYMRRGKSWAEDSDMRGREFSIYGD